MRAFSFSESWFFPEYEIEQHAEHRQRKDRNDPSDLVRGVAVAADKIDDNNGGENEANTVKDGKVLVEPGDGKVDSGKLQRNECAGEYGAGKTTLKKFFMGFSAEG